MTASTLKAVAGSISCAEDRLKDRKTSGRPVPGGFRGLLEQCFGQRIDKAAFFGEWNEHARRDEAEFLVGPAGKRLEALDRSVGEIHDRLEMYSHFIGDDGPAKRLLDLCAAAHLLGDFLRIDGDLAAAASLGPVERGVGALEQFGKLFTGKRIDGKAEGRRQADVAVAKIVGRRQDILEHPPIFSAPFFSKTNGRMKANSSLSIRATKPPSGKQARNRCATWHRISSPAA
jgi:hypothetical protein